MLAMKFQDCVMATWKAQAPAGGKKGKGDGKKGGKKEEPKKEEKKPEPKKEEEDDMDLFGDDDDDEDQDARMAAKAAQLKAQGKLKEKKAVIAKSMILFECKPLDSETDLDALAARILADIVMDGLQWKTEYKKAPVAFGIFKLIIGCTIEDDKVSSDDLVEKMEAMDDMVQSVDIAAFNKV